MVHIHRNPRGRERLYPTNLAHKFNVREWCTCRERQTSADTSRFVFIRRKSLRAFVAPLYANQNGVVVVAAARPSHLHTRGMLSLRLFFSPRTCNPLFFVATTTILCRAFASLPLRIKFNTLARCIAAHYIFTKSSPSPTLRNWIHRSEFKNIQTRGIALH